MKNREILNYIIILLTTSVVFYIHTEDKFYYNIPQLLMLILPVIQGYKVKLSFNIRDILIGFMVSLALLIPFYVFFSVRDLSRLDSIYVIYQLLVVALPEEFFFRGYLQDSFGRNYKAIVIVSILFSFAHLPKAIFLNDWLSMLSFFPSLIMGWLYLKTENILTGTIFHWIANVVYKSTIFV
jgi:membrane protease YdiL (CAAX protease family)